MIDIQKKIEAIESRNKNDAKTTIALVMRSWQAFRFLGPEYDMRVLLQRANHAAIAAHRRNLVHLELYSLAVFVAIEARHYDNANEMLDKAMAYKNHLKAGSPFFYGTLCFLYAYLELSQRRARSAKKHRRALADHIKNAPPSPHYAVMQGLLSLAAGELPEAYTHLTEALHAGCNSIFLYEGLFRYYKTAPSGFEGLSILPVLIYAANRGADIGAVAAKYADTLSSAIAADPPAGERLYAASNYPPILKDICTHRIKNGDMSAEAFAFYRDAEKKQVYTPELFNALVRAAYQNKSPHINRYPLKKFMEGAGEISEPNFAVYVYHFLLNDTAFADLLPDAQSKILQLGTRCLEAGIKGREANSIYFYLWSRFRALGISGVDLDKAEEILRENLTLFELHTQENSAVRYIYITEQEKRRMEVYETQDNSPIIIEAVSENAGYTCLGKSQREILGEEVTIKRMIGQAGPELYLYFFRKGDRRFHLLAYLANYYLSPETPTDDAAPVFEAILQEKGITKAYKMKILVALGRLHYNAFSFEQALECFGEIDENLIEDDFIEQLLSIYMQTREFTRAAKLIYSKYAKISQEILFETVKQLLPKCDEHTTKIIAEIGYNLLANNFHDDELLNFVLENYRASYSEWANLSQVIDEDNRTAPALDAQVIESALAMSSFCQHAQKAFTRLHGTQSENPLLEEFTELATYEMLANSTRPNYDVLSILEKTYLKTVSAADSDASQTLLAWGLAGVYLQYNITTFKSEEIIKYAISTMENEGILFPVFKENKTTPTPFMEKFQPFLYKSLPDKDCWLYYRIEGAASYVAVPMQYVRYGIYLAAVPMFYNETLSYYFSEEMASGSITTKERSVKNAKPFIHENPADPYFTINNAIICEQMFKHDQLEKLISSLVKDVQPVKAVLL
ncbi:MAG: DUF5717 family protein [Defluviitaleaceae bacterium]|nr:DUF5717 family protein [Defluviitaleaceae bacterium]MCL2262539.1 DUF5717 family protein [Defluviitaleaceae bacterium]